jgi:hypothetical protein
MEGEGAESFAATRRVRHFRPESHEVALVAESCCRSIAIARRIVTAAMLLLPRSPETTRTAVGWAKAAEVLKFTCWR